MSEDDPRFSAQEYGALLRWMMVTDPWATREYDRETLIEMLNDEADARDYDDWVHAYHELCDKEEDGDA